VAGLKQATATSAGGVVVRYEAGIPRFVAGRRNDVRTWSLPKGTPIAGESTEETAVREVTEETGLHVRIVDSLDLIEYTFSQRGTRVHKTVYYYLMEPTGGDLAGHDHEFDEVRWFELAEAGSVLSFESERALVERAADRLVERAGGPTADADGPRTEGPASGA
jgi:8-oxo-dGTP pyrophosphatase MutT (NUDIX family)